LIVACVKKLPKNQAEHFGDAKVDSELNGCQWLVQQVS